MVETFEAGGTVHIVQRMEPGGIQTLILDMMQAEPNPADRIYSLEADQRELIEEWPLLEQFKGHLVCFKRSGGGLSLELVRRIAASLRENRTNTVIVHHIGPLLYGAAGARLARVPNIIHVEHDSWHYENRKHQVFAAVSSRLFRPSHVAVSQQVAERMREIIGKRDIHVIPPAIDASRFRPGSQQKARELIGLSTEIKLVGSAGRLVEVKAYDVLIDAIAMLPDNVHLVLVGDGPERDSLQDRARGEGVGERVHFLGLRADLPEIIPALDTFCLSSHNEGLPRVVLEAQSCGVPVVATDVGAMRDAVCGETGRIVPPGDAGALAEGLRKQLAAEIPASVTRQYILDRYGLDNMMKAFGKVTENA